MPLRGVSGAKGTSISSVHATWPGFSQAFTSSSAKDQEPFSDCHSLRRSRGRGYPSGTCLFEQPAHVSGGFLPRRRCAPVYKSRRWEHWFQEKLNSVKIGSQGLNCYTARRWGNAVESGNSG